MRQFAAPHLYKNGPPSAGHFRFCGLDQWSDRRAHNPDVVGSNPTAATIHQLRPPMPRQADIAGRLLPVAGQLPERTDMSTSIWQEFKQWVDLLWHHATNGTLPPAPTAASGPVAISPAPAPSVSPSPVPTPAATATLSDGVLEVDSRGFAKLAAIENQRATDPKWHNAPMWYAIEGLPNETFEARANLTEAKEMLAMGSTGAVDSGVGVLNNAYAMTQVGTGFGYQRGTPYPDARSFIGDNVDAGGNVVYRGLRPSDIPAWVAACNANYEKFVAQNYPHPEDAIPSTVFRGG